MPRPEIQSVTPPAVLPGGRLTIRGTGFDVRPGHVPSVGIGGVAARVVRASPRELVAAVPADVAGGQQPITISGLEGATPYVTVGTIVTTAVHQVDSPVYDRQGRLYATLSGQRGQQTPVSVFRIGLDGAREPFVTGLGNATSLAFGPDDALYVSSRFEGIVSRVDESGQVEKFAQNLGVAFGLAFTGTGDLMVGDRSGTVHRVTPDGHATAFASIPPSIAAFHLAAAPDDTLVVAAPTLNSSDALYRVSTEGEAARWRDGFGRPQGVAFDAQGRLHVVDALAGDSVVYRLGEDGEKTVVVSGEGLIGVTFDPTDDTMTVCTDDTIYRIQR